MFDHIADAAGDDLGAGSATGQRAAVGREDDRQESGLRRDTDQP